MRTWPLAAVVLCNVLLACSSERPDFQSPSNTSDESNSGLVDAGSTGLTASADDSDELTSPPAALPDASIVPPGETQTEPMPPLVPSQAPEDTDVEPATDTDPGPISTDTIFSDAGVDTAEEDSTDQTEVEPPTDTEEPDPDPTDTIVGDSGVDTSEGDTGGQLAVGETCTEDEECSAGTCQDSALGGRICCAANCGDCKQCAATGDSCTDLLETRPGCECEPDDTSNCNDGIPCTDDNVCVNGQCENPVSAGSCLIAGQCVSQGASEPNNPCRVCDPQLQPTGWSAASSQVSCDDELWCNGTDACNGSGACGHEYPAGNRCALSGPCALSTCNEQRDSCFETEGTECSSATEVRCQDTSCGGDVQVRTNVGYCDGQSASCADIVPGTWATQTNCGGSQTCDAQTLTCVDTLGCGSTWCDTQGTLCWMTSLPADKMTLAEATTYCNDLVLAGRSQWRLPTSNELASTARGCDGTDGTLEDVDFRSTCRTTTDNLGYSNCTACSTNGGPTSGCYWPTELGTCPSADTNFWSSTAMPSLPGVYYYFQFRYSRFGAGGDTTEQYVRCVTTR